MAELLTWKAVVAFIGGIGTVCMTVWRIMSMKNDDVNADLKKQIAEASENNAVQKIQIEDLERRLDRLQASHDKLSDLILKLLTGK